MKRFVQRAALAIAAFATVFAFAADPDWEVFRRAFIEADGRVLDTGQGRISHSEGQGFAMLLAVHYEDRATFQRAWQWTQRNLQVRDDALLAWKWEPPGGVSDRNNATDADVLVAWALARAAAKWKQPEYEEAARRICRDIRGKLVKRVAHGLVLVPALEGFDKPDGMTINLSYWVFPAFRELARIDPASEWDDLAKNGVTILEYSYFGRWRLPPDWLKLGERVAPGGPPPERFGYDAVRIPVYLLWSRQETPALLKPYRDFWGHFGSARDLPAWTNLKDDSVDSYGASVGIRAIAQAVREYPKLSAGRLPALAGDASYYSAVLLLLTKVALRERGEP
jgi:endo-1,4-beta-D-glucanase Y